MPTPPGLSTTLLCGGATSLTLLSIYLYHLTGPSRNYLFSHRASPGHDRSLALTLLNPKGYRTEQDRFSVCLEGAAVAGLSEGEIVARFTRGFFGGWVFTPERWIFTLMHYSGLDQEALAGISPVNLTSKPMRRNGHALPANKTQIWSPSALSRTTPPPLGALLFGNFVVFDSPTATAQDREALFPGAAEKKHDSAPDGIACVEVVAGPTRAFGGLLPSHRFEVQREEGTGVWVTLSHVRCDPYTGVAAGGRWSWWLGWFHLVYARLLFADGLREVVGRGW